jgi:hypothetical protein
LGTIFLCFGLTIPTFFSPRRTHIATINQFSDFLFGVIVSTKNATHPFRIPIPVGISGQNRTISKFKTDAGASGDGRFLKSTNVL